MLLTKEEQFHYKLLGIDPSKLYLVVNNHIKKLNIIYGSTETVPNSNLLANPIAILFQCDIIILPVRGSIGGPIKRISWRLGDCTATADRQTETDLINAIINLTKAPCQISHIIEKNNPTTHNLIDVRYDVFYPLSSINTSYMEELITQFVNFHRSKC